MTRSRSSADRPNAGGWEHARHPQVEVAAKVLVDKGHVARLKSIASASARSKWQSHWYDNRCLSGSALTGGLPVRRVADGF
jgi:hypothetical protein